MLVGKVPLAAGFGGGGWFFPLFFFFFFSSFFSLHFIEEKDCKPSGEQKEWSIVLLLRPAVAGGSKFLWIFFAIAFMNSMCNVERV